MLGTVALAAGEVKVMVGMMPSTTSALLNPREFARPGVARVRPGQICFEIGGVAEDLAKQALVRVAHKMPIRCRFVKRRHVL